MLEKYRLILQHKIGVKVRSNIKKVTEIHNLADSVFLQVNWKLHTV